MLNDLFLQRQSYESIASDPVPEVDIADMLEAFRWGPSSSNAQPWNIVVVRGGSTLLPALSKGNAAWATRAPLAFVICATPKPDPKPGRENMFLFDAGLASENLLLQATFAGYVANPTAGWVEDEIKKICAIPETVTVACIIFVGKKGRPEDVDEITRAKINNPRTRKNINEFVFEGAWGNAYK